MVGLLEYANLKCDAFRGNELHVNSDQDPIYTDFLMIYVPGFCNLHSCSVMSLVHSLGSWVGTGMESGAGGETAGSEVSRPRNGSTPR